MGAMISCCSPTMTKTFPELPLPRCRRHHCAKPPLEEMGVGRTVGALPPPPLPIPCNGLIGFPLFSIHGEAEEMGVGRTVGALVVKFPLIALIVDAKELAVGLPVGTVVNDAKGKMGFVAFVIEF